MKMILFPCAGMKLPIPCLGAGPFLLSRSQGKFAAGYEPTQVPANSRIESSRNLDIHVEDPKRPRL